jgi:hypothetical protein
MSNHVCTAIYSEAKVGALLSAIAISSSYFEKVSVMHSINFLTEGMIR